MAAAPGTLASAASAASTAPPPLPAAATSSSEESGEGEDAAGRREPTGLSSSSEESGDEGVGAPVHKVVYMAAEATPSGHGPEHVGLYYKLDPPPPVAFPEGFPRDLAQEFAVTRGGALMIRAQGRQLAAAMDAHAARHAARSGGGGGGAAAAAAAAAPGGGGGSGGGGASPAVQLPRFRLVMGEAGAGKSAILAYAVHHARTSGWVALYVPDARKSMTKGLILSRSRTRPGFVDQHDVSHAVLRALLTAHAPALARVPQRGTYSRVRYLPHALVAHENEVVAALSKKDEAARRAERAAAEKAGTGWDPATFKSALAAYEAETGIDRSSFTLRDMVEWAVADPSSAGESLVHVREELCACTEVPVLFAIDGFNCLYEPNILGIDGKECVRARASPPPPPALLLWMLLLALLLLLLWWWKWW
jgi:hypothetical protein